MKKKVFIISFFVLVFVSGTNLMQAQNQLVGEWVNSYNSLLKITQQNPDGSLAGIYSSTTGSSGTYQVTGQYSINPSNNNVAISLLISWNSLDGSTADPSKFWTSAMNGTLYSGQNSIELINCISAPTPFGAVQIDEPGIYPESLTFNRRTSSNLRFENNLNSQAENRAAPSPITGTWNLSDGSQSLYTRLVLNSSGGTRFDILSGTVKVRGIQTPIAITGIISHQTSDNKYSLSFTVKNPILLSGQDRYIIGFTGLLDVANNDLRLVNMETRAVGYNVKYNSVRMNQSSYAK
ncbi:avidin/streptavidin family protein [Kordia sp.]|uniref:avidin/streptavidin family protein n=1 Tax=Kordia sp. TaxID=1965332 RepID=UPI003D6BDB63